MPQYSIETSILEDLGRCEVLLTAVQEDGPAAEDECVIDVDDIGLLFGAVMLGPKTYDLHRASLEPFVLGFANQKINEVIEYLWQESVNLKSQQVDIQGHFFSQCYLGALDKDQIGNNIWNLERSTDVYFNELIELIEETDNTIGRLFRPHINFEPGDNLVRTYQFLGRTRTLVIPNRGDYKRIDLPEDLVCHNSLCRVGKICQSVKRMNELIARIDWLCLQIAHKMKDHQETTIPNGPYWVINPE